MGSSVTSWQSCSDVDKYLSFQHGIDAQRAASLNDSPVFIRALADIAAKHLKDYSTGAIGPASVQMGLRCPGCTNVVCGQQKAWFAGGGQ